MTQSKIVAGGLAIGASLMGIACGSPALTNSVGAVDASAADAGTPVEDSGLSAAFPDEIRAEPDRKLANDSGAPDRVDSGLDTGLPDGSPSDSGLNPETASGPETGSTSSTAVVDGGVGASSFHSVNWAVNGDNYQTGPLLLSGITSASDSYAGVQAKANLVLGAFIDLLKANTVRVPINEPTTTGAWWASYKAVIDAAVAKNMKVMVAYWAYHNGRPDDINAFYAMWQVVVDAYATNPLVYFDIHNEPYGYTESALIQQVKDWIAKFPTVPKSRIIVPGRGWDDNVVGMGAAFPGLLLQLHIYAIGKSMPVTEQGWRSAVTSVVGPYSNRTIVGEWGARMAGNNYDLAINGNIDLAYVDGVANQIHDSAMGSGFWPGLWAVTGNVSSWSLLNLYGNGNSLTFSVQNPSGLRRVQHSWGLL